jgi:hypothetical protein
MIKRYSFLWMSLFSSLCLSSWGTQPAPPDIGINIELRGTTGIVQLENKEKYPVSLIFYPGDLGTIKFEVFKIRLASQEKAEIKLSEVAARNGRQIFHLQSSASLDDRQRLNGPSLYQPFFISDSEAKKLSYEEAFLSQRERIEGESELAKIDLGGALDISEMGMLAFKSNLVPSGFSIQPMELRSPLEYSKMEPKQSPRETEVARTTDGTQLDESFTQNQSQNSSSASFATNIKGHMSLKVGPGTYKAAWGWVVRAWQQVGGIWVYQGWDYVAGDGSWNINLPAALPWLPVRVEYRTKNRFVSVQDPAGKPYTWGDNWNLTGSTTDVGYRYADLTVNADLPGVDKLYVGSTNIWVKFYNNGMNALRDDPIEVTFPNSLASGKCIYDNGSGPYAWSCSYWGDGKIYIIPAHGSESVVQHEIAHSINSYYWDGNMPPGSGGSHNLWDCYNNGLALTEGFANFVTYWTQFNRNALSPIAPYFNMNIESLPGGVCANQMAEMRVASTFWDMYDTRSDGPDPSTTYDGLNYVNQAVPVSIYLNNKRNSMAEYLAVVQAGQSAYWQGQFTKLFRLGKIVP